mgnify:CR=1 FL=1
MKEKIILDVDTGQDDMVAIVMASGLDEIEVMGIVAVAGNQTLEKTLRNTLNVCQYIGETAPVYAGMDRPILREQVVGGDIHGESGLDGPVFPPLKRKAENLHGVQFIIDTVLAHPHEITLVPTGPLTDIAMAIRLEPRLPSLVKNIVLMGGSLGKGNRTLHAEFNIYADAEAAAIVFNSGSPIVMMGLDVTLKVQLDEAEAARYEKLTSATARMFCAGMARYRDACRLHGSEFPAMHDPCCIAYIADEALFTTVAHEVTVEVHDPETYGKTTGKVPSDDSRSILVGVDADVPGFWKLLDRSFTQLP